jgi:DNA gyrase subunit A
MKNLTNWFDIKNPLVVYDSNSGSIQGGPQAAMRYTESYMSKFALECVIGELSETNNVIDWQHTFDNKNFEPEALPVKVPLLLVNGLFAIAIGRRIEVPSHSLNDVIDATIDQLHHPNHPVILIPDPCQKCEVMCSDWNKIASTGFGHYIQRGIIKTVKDNKTGVETLRIMSMPDNVYSDTVVSKIEELIKSNKLVQIADIQDHSTEDQLDIWIILKKGADSNFVKQILYKNTDLQDLKRVNMEVISGLDLKRIDYKTYIQYFLEYRRNVKFRLYNARLQKVTTRQHMIEPYVKILDSGEVDKIINLIKNQKHGEEDYLVEYLIKKLEITDLQAKFILNIRIKQLTKAQLAKYKDEYKALDKQIKEYYNIITNRSIIDKEIEAELIDIRARYGKPRMSVEISEAQASNIPEGEFKIVVTENNFIKKIAVNDPIKAFKGDNAKCVLLADNAKDILLFDNMGKVFRLAVNKIAFTEKNSPGTDIRLISKKLTSNIIAAMYQPIVKNLDDKKTKFFLVISTRRGLVKKIDLGDIVNAVPSGLLYSRINPDDEICNVLIANAKCDVIMYSRSKALRITIDSIPHLKRATLGSIGMKTPELQGMSIVSAEIPDVIVVTYKGRFNKLSQAALQRGTKGRSGNKVINLVKNDYIVSILSCDDKAQIKVIRNDNEELLINVKDIPMGSSVSSGTKICKDGIVKAEIIR